MLSENKKPAQIHSNLSINDVQICDFSTVDERMIGNDKDQ